MKKIMKPTANALRTSLYIYLVAGLCFCASCNKNNESRALKDFDQVNLVANNNEYSALHTDPALLNAWGLAFSSGGTPWVNSTGGHVSAVYDKDGAFIAARPAVNIPSPVAVTGGSPTGIVFNSTATDFLLSNGRSAAFIFVGVDGVLSAWNGPAGNNALLIKNNSATAAYTGLTLAMKGGANYLYAANFRAGSIDVWDRNFAPVSMSFKDTRIPKGYSPFNIQVISGTWLYVTYAKVGPDGHDQAGAGNGFVDVFNTDGTLAKRFSEKGPLNSPWGVAMAPASFFVDMNADQDDKNSSGHGNSGNSSGISKGSNDESIILVGNFGDGRINAYRQNGDFLGQLKSHGRTIRIDGLWSLVFPPATATAIDPNRLYFTAGPDDEKDGVFGYLIKK